LGQANKCFEDPLLLVGWNSWAIVAHFHPDLVFHARAASSILPSSGVNLMALQQDS